MNMNKKQKVEYLKNLSFGLKDKSKVEQRYNKYKVDKFRTTIKENKEEFLYHLDYLSDKIKGEMNNNPYSFCVGLDLRQRKNIRMFKTYVNTITFNTNQGFFKEVITCKNPTEIRCFSIKFYLLFYNRINRIMKSVLSDYVMEWEKKTILKKLNPEIELTV